jgi:hypothetical protein
MLPTVSRVIVVALVMLVLQRPAHALDLATCGQVIAAGEVGVLRADLSGCDYGVALGDHAVLEMAGHSIAANNLGVLCSAPRCTVRGPGDISGGQVGIWGYYPTGNVEVSDVDIHDSNLSGIENARRARVTNVSVRRVGFGALNPEYSAGIYVDKLRGTNVTAADNAGYGVLGGTSAKLTALTATGNGNAGIAGQGHTLLRDSVVTGNDGYERGIDLVAYRRPRVIDTTCGLSSSPGPTAEEPGPPWGVCTGD